MKRVAGILSGILLLGILLGGCNSSSSSSRYDDGMIQYNGEWITVQEYELIKSGDVQDVPAAPAPAPTPPPESTPPPTPTPKSDPEPEEDDFEWLYDSIVYKITGTADSVFVTLIDEDGDISQYSDVSVPHEYEYEVFDHWYAHISAQNNDDSGSVTVSIYLNGNKAKTSTSSGAYVIAQASLSLY